MDHIIELEDKKTIVMRMQADKIELQMWSDGKHTDYLMDKKSTYFMATRLLDMIVKGE